MRSPLTGKKLTTKSLWGKLNLYSSVWVLLAVLSGIILFSTLTVKIQKKERQENLNALASTLARLVARPVSQGDYLLVEHYINGGGLPEFLKSIEVKDEAGRVIAGKTHPISQVKGTCTLDTVVSQPVLDSSPLATGSLDGSSVATIELTASNCDIVAAQKSFVLNSLGFGLLVFLVLIGVNRASIYLALRPLSRTVKFGITRGQLEDCVIQNSPLEIRPLMTQMRDLYQEVAESNARAKVGEFAAQIAHDIRSPLAALDSSVRDFDELPEERRSVLTSAVSRIKDIANGLIELNREAKLLNSRQVTETQATDKLEVYLLSSLIDPLVTEKRVQYRTNIDVTIEGCTSDSCYGLFARVVPLDFKRMLSNLIDNAVEAIPEKGKVSISVRKVDSENLSVIVADNGKGISPDILPKLMKRGATFGKDGGSGLGLYQAKMTADSYGGALEIESDVEAGTLAKVILPIATPPSWFVERIVLGNKSTILIVDDDESIHRVWQGRLEALKSEYPFSRLTVVHLSSVQEFRAWMQGRPHTEVNDILCLMDYELRDSKESGLDLIEEFSIETSSILVTSRYEEKSVLDRVIASKLLLIPKGMAGFVPLVIEDVDSYDAILIDDESINLLSWDTSAKRKGLRLKTFKSLPSLHELARYKRSTPIYIDSNLGKDKFGNAIRGELVAKEYFALGFKNISLTTGFSPEDFEQMPWISNIYGKIPPWESKSKKRVVNVSEVMT